MAKKTAKSAKGKGKKARPAGKKAGKAKSTKKKVMKTKRPMRGKEDPGTLVAYERRGLGARSAGQSGDTQGLSASPTVDAESVEELMEEGQSFEAEVLNGIERASDADEGEVRTHEVPEDDVPEEYREED
jgi:hypothetical protein